MGRKVKSPNVKIQMSNQAQSSKSKKTFIFFVIWVLDLICHLIFGFWIFAFYASLSFAQDGVKKPSVTEEAITAGEKIYKRRCFFCHGQEGDGNGPVADYLDPRPRDFTIGIFKFRTTESGALPTDEDLFRIVSKGIPGTAMPTWELYLSETERWQVVYYIKTFFPEFSLPELDPYKKVINVTNNISPTPENIAKGKEIYQREKCWECHGQEARGDGKKISELEDDWGFPLRPFDLTKGWKFKGGSSPKDIYYRFTTGVNGTPMPSFIHTLPEEDRWHLANYIFSLNEGKPGEEVILKSKFINGQIPLDPNDPLWKNIPFLRIPLSGQVTVKPRWQNPSVDVVSVRSVYNEKEIAFLLEWDDPTEDTIHQDIKVNIAPEDTYVKPSDLPRRPGVFRDSIALQFPVKIPEGPVKPHFFRGNPRSPVNLWIWKADWQREGKKSAVEEINANGFENPLSSQPSESQNTKGRGVWKDGKWKVVIVRSLSINDDKKDIQFERGKLIPIALNAWDGTNGEHGLIMSLSSWNYLYLETSIPLIAYPFAFLGTIALGGLEVWLIRRSRAIDLS